MLTCYFLLCLPPCGLALPFFPLGFILDLSEVPVFISLFKKTVKNKKEEKQNNRSLTQNLKIDLLIVGSTHFILAKKKLMILYYPWG